MATGAGKTFTAANVCYRLVRHADAARVLFLVDRANLGRQALREFQGFAAPDDPRKFSELQRPPRHRLPGGHGRRDIAYASAFIRLSLLRPAAPPLTGAGHALRPIAELGFGTHVDPPSVPHIPLACRQTHRACHERQHY